MPDFDMIIPEPTNDESRGKAASIKNKRYELSEEMCRVAREVFEEKMLDIRPARVKYVLVYPNIAKTTAATCTLASNMVNFFGECDFIISASGDLWDALSPDLRSILMFHELLHVVCTQNEKTGDWKFSLREHDVQEFKEIINLYGIDWLDELKATFIEAGGFDPGDIDTLGL